MPSPCATCYDALHLCLTASTALLSIAANPPPSISLNPHPCLVLSCRPLLLRHHHLSSTPIASSPPPAATAISFALPIRPLRLLLLCRLLRCVLVELSIWRRRPRPPVLPPDNVPAHAVNMYVKGERERGGGGLVQCLARR